MKLSEVFRRAAERCFYDQDCGWSQGVNHDEHAEDFFISRIGSESGREIWPMFDDEGQHRSTALCMAASIAESEGL